MLTQPATHTHTLWIIPGLCVGSTRSLAEREMKKANGTIHRPQKKNARTCTDEPHFHYMHTHTHTHNIIYTSPIYIYIPLEKGAIQWQSTGRLGNGSPVETLQKRGDNTHTLTHTVSLEPETQELYSACFRIHTLSIPTFLWETSQGNTRMNEEN